MSELRRHIMTSAPSKPIPIGYALSASTPVFYIEPAKLSEISVTYIGGFTETNTVQVIIRNNTTSILNVIGSIYPWVNYRGSNYYNWNPTGKKGEAILRRVSGNYIYSINTQGNKQNYINISGLGNETVDNFVCCAPIYAGQEYSMFERLLVKKSGDVILDVQPFTIGGKQVLIDLVSGEVKDFPIGTATYWNPNGNTIYTPYQATVTPEPAYKQEVG